MTGCSHPPDPTDYSWVKPITFHPQTVTWLKSIDPWPPEAYLDFDQIVKHNEKCKLILPKQ